MQALALANARLRLQQPAVSTADKVAGSAPVRLAIGAAEPILGAGQLAANAVGLGNKELEIPNPFNSEVPLYRSSVNEHMKTLEQSIERGRGPDAGFDAVRFAGNVVSPVNAAMAKALPAAATTAGRTGVGAGAGAVGGALTPVTSGDDYWQNKGAQVGVGAVAGGVLTPVVGKVVDAVAPKVSALLDRFSASRTQMTAAQASLETDRLIEQAMKEIGSASSEVPPQALVQIRQQVNEALKAGKQLDPAALLRKQDFDELRVPGTLGQITRDPTQFATERNLRGADPRLTVRFNDQNRALGERLMGFGAREADEVQTAGSRFVQHLSGVDRKAGGEVSDAYKVAREAAGRDLDVPLTGLAQDIAAVQRDFGSKVPDAIVSRLNEFGIGKAGNQTKVFTINEAEDILQQTNKLRGSDAAVNNALDAINKAVKKAVLAADDQGGVFKAPRDLAAKRFKIQEMVPALRASADGDASADKFVGQFLIRGETSEVQNLAKLLQGSSPELYDQARAQLAKELMRRAYGENPAADAAIKPAQLAQALREFGEGRLKAFFSEPEIAQMRRISRVGAYMESIPSGSPVNTSNTFTAALPTMLQMVPGAEKLAMALRAGAAIGRGVTNERAVTSGLRAEVPITQRPLSQEDRALLAKALAVGGAGVGMGTAAGFK